MLPQYPQFKKLELGDRADIEKFTSQFPPYSDFNFTSMWCWDTLGLVRISELNNNLVVRFMDYLTGEPFYSFLGMNKVNETIEEIMKLSASEGLELKLRFISEEIIKDLNTFYFISEDRSNFDYIYNVSDLYAYHGAEFETQRNLINRFSRKYSKIEVSISILSYIEDDILSFNKKWERQKINAQNQEELKTESKSIARVFGLNNENLLGVCIFCSGELIAYAIDEILDSEYVICHFAKANSNFSGVYSFLMKENCKTLLSLGKKTLNYEQDLGLEGLRYAKNAFRPKKFLKKFIVGYDYIGALIRNNLQADNKIPSYAEYFRKQLAGNVKTI